MNYIARVRTDFPTKFGVPRQSGLAEDIIGRVVFEREYRNPDALRGIEGFSHIWLIWEFSESKRENWSATVRPPRLGGNARLGVFATRSPFRPNPIALSCVRLLRVENDPTDGRALIIAGADMIDNTPVYDIKPYVPLTDCKISATGGFSESPEPTPDVVIPDALKRFIPEAKLPSLICALENDPRPRYQRDAERVYGFEFAGMDVRFCARDGKIVVTDIVR